VRKTVTVMRSFIYRVIVSRDYVVSYKGEKFKHRFFIDIIISPFPAIDYLSNISQHLRNAGEDFVHSQERKISIKERD
jgi:hypothetical protein